MRLIAALSCSSVFLLLLVTAEEDNWSWGKKAVNGEKVTVNATIVEDILISGRQGRALEGFDEVYSDPEVQQALTSGNESRARHYIKERLCGLGLMACDGDIEGKRYLHPEDLIYAQPVNIKPVGRPIPAVPIKGVGIGSAGYGPPRPVPLPSYKYGPPYRPGSYGPPGPPLRPPPPGIYDGPKPSLYEPDITGPYAPTSVVEKKPVVVVNNPNGGGLQQHLHHHHHYVHDGGIKNPVVSGVVGPTAGYDTPSYPPLAPSYGPPGLSSGISPGINHGINPVYANTITGPGYPLYKKELNLNGGSSYASNGLTTSGTSYADKYPSYESPRADYSEGCVCVPYDQCLEVFRKDDGLLIDPRTAGGSNIEALGPEEIVITNGNGTMFTVYKDTTKTKREDSDNKEDKAESDDDGAAVKDDEKESRKKRDASGDSKVEERRSKIKPREVDDEKDVEASARYQVKEEEEESSGRQAIYSGGRCGPGLVCCRRPRQQQTYRPPYRAQCGHRNTHGINGRIKTPVYVDGDSEFGEYPWQVAILKKDPQESVYVCGGTLIDALHIVTAAHCIKSYTPYDLRVRLGEWDVNHDVEFYPFVERDIVTVRVHPEFYAGTLVNDIAIMRMDKPIDFNQNPHISPACLPEPYSDYTGSRCWTTGWGKDAFGDFGKYQNILKEVDVPVVSQQQCQSQLQQTRLGYEFKLHPGFVCAGGEEGKDACKGDGGGPMVCERSGTWQVVGIVSWGIGCGQYGLPGVYVRVSHYLDWIRQFTSGF